MCERSSTVPQTNYCEREKVALTKPLKSGSRVHLRTLKSSILREWRAIFESTIETPVKRDAQN